MPAVPAAFSAAGAVPTAPVPVPASASHWWQLFADPRLDALIALAHEQNTTIAAAAARVTQARALLRGSESARAPQAQLSTSASRQGGPLVNSAGSSGTLITAGAAVSYEVDLFGRLAQGEQAAVQDLASRTAAWQAAQLVVQAEVAQTWLALRSLQVEQAAALQAVQTWRDTLALSEQRWRNGSLPEVQVLRLRAELADSQADAATLERRHAELRHALAVLVGQPASGFTLPKPTTAAPTLPPVPAGLPSRMLARRPDVAAARHSYEAAQDRRGETRSAWFPSLVLTASGGHAAPGLATLLQASARAWGLGLLGALPLFDGGRREAGVQQADAQAEIEFASYRAQVLAALREVEDQLVALGSVAEQAGLQAQSLDAHRRTLAAVESRQRNGLASQLDGLDARRTALRSERRLLQLQAAQAQLTVGLIKALGGGWDVEGSALSGSD